MKRVKPVEVKVSARLHSQPSTTSLFHEALVTSGCPEGKDGANHHQTQESLRPRLLCSFILGQGAANFVLPLQASECRHLCQSLEGGLPLLFLERPSKNFADLFQGPFRVRPSFESKQVALGQFSGLQDPEEPSTEACPPANVRDAPWATLPSMSLVGCRVL